MSREPKLLNFGKGCKELAFSSYHICSNISIGSTISFLAQETQQQNIYCISSKSCCNEILFQYPHLTQQQFEGSSWAIFLRWHLQRLPCTHLHIKLSWTISIHVRRCMYIVTITMLRESYIGTSWQLTAWFRGVVRFRGNMVLWIVLL